MPGTESMSRNDSRFETMNFKLSKCRALASRSRYIAHNPTAYNARHINRIIDITDAWFSKSNNSRNHS
jgi:hypothetical protein